VTSKKKTLIELKKKRAVAVSIKSLKRGKFVTLDGKPTSLFDK
jgi:hypothetical protein